jgi:PDZ domain-containing protein
MLYVSEYEATIPMYLLSYVIPNWDLEKISDQQVNNETTEEIYERNKLMLNNSIDNATYVAYKEAGKKIEVKSKKTVVIATTLNNNLKIGDEVLEVDGKKIEDANDIKEIIKNKEVNSKLDFKISRNDKVENVNVVIKEQDKTKIIGVVIITDYDYDITPQIDIKFKSKETGSSGGLMMALSIYSKISGEDIVKGRKIAGTGTIDIDGTVGEIDGIKYKIMGAVKNKMDVVIVPKDNYKEAIKVKKDNNYDIEIVSVNTFEDAIKYLKKTK